MSKLIVFLLVIVIALGLFIAINPDAHARAIQVWEQAKVAWGQFAAKFSASMDNMKAAFAQHFGQTGSSAGTEKESSTGKEDAEASAELPIVSFLRGLWSSVSSSIASAQ